ncbi:MAG: hypothetical protein L3J59_14485, partial [Methylococcaceae bacterium]|nr:hypothetical protein [Methylococcaceae bacterium]
EYLSRKTRYLVFQLGFNWKGDVKKPLFKNGTKEEMISFITKGVESSWEVKSIGIAEKTNNKYIYKNINTNNIKRDDSLGEFLNRPLFILKSKNII